MTVKASGRARRARLLVLVVVGLVHAGCKADLCTSKPAAFQLDLTVPAQIEARIKSFWVDVTAGAGRHKQQLFDAGTLTGGGTSVSVTVGSSGAAGFVAEVVVEARDAAGTTLARGKSSFTGAGNACNFFKLALAAGPSLPDGGVDADVGPLDGPRDLPRDVGGIDRDTGKPDRPRDTGQSDRPRDTSVGKDKGKDGPVPCPPSCLLGCAPGSSVCRAFVPSNLSGAPPLTSCGDLVLDNVTIDTTTCTVLSCKGTLIPTTPSTCAIAVGKLDIKQTVLVKGQHPLILVASGPVEIPAGARLDGAAKGLTPGPGGWKGGQPPSCTQPMQGEGPGAGTHCTCTDSNYEDCGGGGGGHGAVGGPGGDEGAGCGMASAGGPTYDLLTGLVPLRAGSGGASGHNLLNTGYTLGAGGGGGGAIQISSQQSIKIDGAITVGGGGGGGGSSSNGYAAAAGGGGSGGAILLEAAKVDGTGWVAANGAGGGGGAENGTGQPGQDGRPDGTAALGGLKGVLGGDGGAGGAMGGAGKAGGSSTSTLGGAGGGGGGSGLIRINVPSTFTVPSSLNLSGVQSKGTLTIP